MNHGHLRVTLLVNESEKGGVVMSVYLLRIPFLLLLLCPCGYTMAQYAGEHVSLSGDVDDDVYMAGGQVDLYATVNGDVVAAGGQLNLEGKVRQDVIAAGGEIDLRGLVGDDARLAGGNVRVHAEIGDDLVAAGGRLQVGPKAVITGSAWLAGGEVYVAGRIGEELRVSGGRVIITGTVDGDVEVWADQVEVQSGAVITGKLHYQSPHPAVIADGARIEGEVTYTPVDVPVAPVIAGFIFGFLMILASLMLTGVVLYLLFPGVAQRSCETVRESPWSSLGYGLAVFAGGPVVVLLLLSTGLGVFLALLLLAAWLIMLLLGYLTGAYFVADAGLRRLQKDQAGRSLRSVSLVLSILALAVVNLIPVIGGIVNGLLLFAGIGALIQQMIGAYTNTA
jgi:hypothetical protein